MRSIISVWVVLSAIQLNAQAYFSTTYGSPYPFFSGLGQVIQLPDSGYLAAFDESEYMNLKDDLDIIKYDKIGNVIDHKKYGTGDDSTGYAAGYISKFSDSLNLVIAFEYTGISAWNTILLLVNADGDSIHATRYAHPGAYQTFINSYIPDGDGSYFFLGQTDYYDSVQNPPPFPASFDFTDRQLLIVKMDSAFNVIWAKEFGKPNISESALEVVLTPDGGIIAAGRKYDYDKVNAWIFKFNAQGNVVWQQGWLQTGQNRAFSKIIQTKDGNYLACGPWRNDPIDFPNDPKGEGGCLMKVKPNGQLIWQKEYRSETDENNFYDMVQLDDGSLVLVGYEDYDNTTGESDQTAKLTKLDANGNVIWNRTYDYFKKTRTTAIEKTFDGGFVISGWALLEGPTPKSSIGWILKVDSMGCESSICTVDIAEPEPTKTTEIQLFPNPANDLLNLQMPENGHFDIKIVDILGKTLLTDSFFGDRFSMDVSRLPTGLVVVQISEKGVLVGVKKVVIAR